MQSPNLPATFFPMPAVYQIAYVTTDLNHALAIYRDRFGISEFRRINDRPLPTSGGGSACISIALAFIGETQLELIEPRGGDDAIYRDYLPGNGFASRLHHLGYDVSSEQRWQELLAAINRQGIRIPVRCSLPNAEIIYTDCREDLGHYLEYFLFSSAGRVSQSEIPRYR